MSKHRFMAGAGSNEKGTAERGIGGPKYYTVTLDDRVKPGKTRRIVKYRYDDVPIDMPMTDKVKAIYEFFKTLFIPSARGTFDDLNEDDLRSLYAALQRCEVSFLGGRFTRLPIMWILRVKQGNLG